jgi:hypothetical protein
MKHKILQMMLGSATIPVASIGVAPIDFVKCVRRDAGHGTRDARTTFLTAMLALFLCVGARAQVNSGSNGSDGAFNPTTNTVINMADHPTGIYQYTSVNIPSGVTVTFIPNANNSPATWLVQGNVVISGTVSVSGMSYGNGTGNDAVGGAGGPGGWNGGNGGSGPSSGQGPGGGVGLLNTDGGNASYAGLGAVNNSSLSPGSIYGNKYIIPLIGGSGGGGTSTSGGGGGGGAILIAASGAITVTGTVSANGGNGGGGRWSGSGSGGAIRLVASQILGTGGIHASGGSYQTAVGGSGYVRFDTYDNGFSGNIAGIFTQGSQFTIVPLAGQLPQLTVTSVGGVSVSSSPTGTLSTPDAVLSSQQSNPIPIVVSCSNLPLNTPITVSVRPANSLAVSATGYNTAGTLASSTATIAIIMPRGGGYIYAAVATGN